VKRTRLLLPLLLAFALLVAACGSDDNKSSGSAGSSTTGAKAASDIDPKGVLKVATFMDQMNMKLDAENSYGTVTHHGALAHIFGMPLILGRDGTVKPWLAESYKIVDSKTMTLTLRKGLTFQDGAPYDAQTLVDTFKHEQELTQQGSAAFAATVIPNIESMDVDGATGITFHLNAPVAGLLPYTLAGAAGYAVSPASKPPDTIYGAGPFQVVSFAKDDKLVVKKWDGFFQADKYKLAGVEWYNIPQIEAAQNALESGQVDLIATNPRDVDALLARGKFDKVITNNQGHYMLAVCQSKPPFDDPKVREAFDLAINRKQLNDAVLGGHGAPMESLWNPGSTFEEKGLIDPDGDLAKAKKLLADSGYAGKEFTIGVYPGYQTHQLIAETVAGQVEKAGFKPKVAVMEGYQVDKYTGQGGVHVVAQINEGVNAVVVPARGKSTAWNPCGYDDPTLNAMLDKIVAGDLDQAELKSTWKDVQEYIVGKHLWFPLLTQPAVYAYNSDRVQGLQEGTIGLTGATAPSPFLEGVSIKAKS
jgi:ABC-type transport system substrate-binding protein